VGSDEGKPVTAVEPDSEAGRAFQALAERVAVELKPKKVFRPELTIR
jgi:ATP-binding protein involved in chromosome partitioning